MILSHSLTQITLKYLFHVCNLPKYQGKCLSDYMLRPILLFQCRDGPRSLESAVNRGRNMTSKVGNSVESADESI